MMYDLVTLATWQLYGFYALSGVAKLLLPSSVFAKDFPSLPLWLWPVVGTWELISVMLYVINSKLESLLMSAAVLGGIFFSITLLKGEDGRTMFTRNVGLGTLPAFCSLGSTLLLIQHEGIEWPIVATAFSFGAICGVQLNRK